MTELLGVPTSDVDVMMGTFTKSFGSVGGARTFLIRQVSRISSYRI